MPDKIKACPFCANETEDDHRSGFGLYVFVCEDSGSHCVACRRCGAEGPEAEDDDFAIQRWNKRVKIVRD